MSTRPKHLFRRTVRHSLVWGLLITLFACGGGESPPTALPVAPAASTISISPGTLSLIVGGQALLAAQAFDAANHPISATFVWSSADRATATVDATGLVRGVSPGATTIVATVGAISATVAVSVRPSNPLLPAVSLSIWPTSMSVIVGSTQVLSTRAVDANGFAAKAEVPTWFSADPAIATVGKTDGIITAVSPGTAKISATAGALSATLSVSVIDIAGSYAFARWTGDRRNGAVGQVLSYSKLDHTTRVFGGTGKFRMLSEPSWSPDGSKMAVEAIYEVVDYPMFEGIDYTSDLYVIDLAAPESAPWRALTTNGLSKGPSWSPDGTRIAYLEEPTLLSLSNIFTIDLASGQRAQVTQLPGLYGRPSWSPDSKRLAFSYELYSGSDIFTINADGSGLVNVTRQPSINWNAAWAPDGRRVAFISSQASTPGDFHVDIYVADIDGRNVQRLTYLTDFASSPAWSPDGRQIMFSSAGAVYVMNADGSSLGRLTNPPPNYVDGSPMWRR